MSGGVKSPQSSFQLGTAAVDKHRKLRSADVGRCQRPPGETKRSGTDKFPFVRPWPACTVALCASPIGSGFYPSDRSVAERP